MMLAYFGGVNILDLLLAAFYANWKPGEPATLGVYLRPEAKIDTRVQAIVATYALPVCQATSQMWFEVHLQLMQAEAARDRDRRAALMEPMRQYMIRCARRWLNGEPLPKIRRKPRADRGAGCAKSRNGADNACACVQLATLEEIKR
jgi:hypothetical protein